ncbi:MAG: DUF3619 family protein [Sulfuritalea sp.]|nr:DUF3619 family protein [Sulfuritalea sp.]
MNDDTEIGYKVRQTLNQGLDTIDNNVSRRLDLNRQAALENQRMSAGWLRLTGIGHVAELAEFVVFSNARTLLAVMALSIGAAGTYYWKALEQTQEFAEIDSALLADELPPSAYIDRGFNAWLERASDSSLQ